MLMFMGCFGFSHFLKKKMNWPKMSQIVGLGCTGEVPGVE